MEDETIHQLRSLLSAVKEKLLHAERVIRMSSLTCPIAQNYVEKNYKEMNDLSSEFGTQINSANENEPPGGQPHDAHG